VTTATGSFSIQRFARTTDDSLAAFGTLSLSFTDPTSNALRTIVTQTIVPLKKSTGGTAAVAPENQAVPISPTTQSSPATQDCQTLRLLLGPLQLDLLGTSIQLKEMNLDFTAMPGASTQLGTQLCDVNKQFDASAPPSETMKTLNTLLDTVG
jgi:hypothetical protein